MVQRTHVHFELAAVIRASKRNVLFVRTTDIPAIPPHPPPEMQKGPREGALSQDRTGGHSAQLTAVRSVAWVGALDQRPCTPALATVSAGSWNRYPLT